MELQHVSVPIPAEGRDAARAFYAGLLGLPEREVPPRLDPAQLIWFRVGGDLELHLFASGERAARAQHFCLRLGSGDGGLAALRRRLEDAGVATEEPEEIVGRPRFTCRDPFGNLIELSEWETSPGEREARSSL